MSRWDREYRNMPAGNRAALNELVNELFRQETGFEGKIDPRTQPQYAAKWLEIRDNVMANRERFSRWLNRAGAALADLASAIPILKGLDTTPQWIRIARAELDRGVREEPGKEKNLRITEYIRTCTVNLKPDQQKSWEKMGEDGVEWCACFVNWCLQQAGSVGLNSAWAPSWAHWGTPLPVQAPKKGAIVCFRWTKPHIEHLAFCDEVNGEFRMLGGNQSGWAHGGQVSSVPFPKHAAVRYLWPLNA
jgi:uncharacterized protein (TIGR02594 family)